MSQVYTQDNVPEEIAKRFPGIYNKFPRSTQAVSANTAQQGEEAKQNEATEAATSAPALVQTFARITQYQVPLFGQATVVQSPQVIGLANPHALGNSGFITSATTTPAVTYTQDNVPEEIQKRFPNLKVSTASKKQ